MITLMASWPTSRSRTSPIPGVALGLDVDGHRLDDSVRLRLGGHLWGKRRQHALEGIQVVDLEGQSGALGPVQGHEVGDPYGTGEGLDALGLSAEPAVNVLDGVGDDDSW